MKKEQDGFETIVGRDSHTSCIEKLTRRKALTAWVNTTLNRCYQLHSGSVNYLLKQVRCSNIEL
jgi:hypothetical protein